MESHPRLKATYKGDTLGWFDTLSEANQAIEQARKEEKEEEQNFRAWLQN